MPVSYYEQLKAQLTEAATAKKAALDAAYDRATTAMFDAAGNASYKKDASGNNMYGTRDVQYLEQKRNIGTGAEAGGTLRSGQNQRNLVNADVAYRSDLGSLAANLTTQKGIVDTDTATKSAEYQAMYGKEGALPGGGSSSSSSNSGGGLPGTVTAPKAITGPGGSVLSPSSQKAMAEAYKRYKTPSYGNPAAKGSSKPAVTPRPKYQPGR